MNPPAPKLTTRDLRPLMVFRETGPTVLGGGSEFVIDEINSEKIQGRICVNMHLEPWSLAAEELLNPDKWTLNVSQTIGTMSEAIKYLRANGIVRPLQSQSDEKELSEVLWFLASLTCDHEPGCAIKQGNASSCSCDKLIPDEDPWRARIRAALQLPSSLGRQIAQLQSEIAELKLK